MASRARRLRVLAYVVVGTGLVGAAWCWSRWTVPSWPPSEEHRVLVLAFRPAPGEGKFEAPTVPEEGPEVDAGFPVGRLRDSGGRDAPSPFVFLYSWVIGAVVGLVWVWVKGAVAGARRSRSRAAHRRRVAKSRTLA